MSRPKDIMANTHSQYSSRNSNTMNISNPRNHPQLAINGDAELNWRYLPTADTYSSEYSAASEADEGDDDEPVQAVVAAALSASHQQQQQRLEQRGVGTRPLLAPASSTSSVQKATTSSPVASGLFATSPGAAHEADDSTDTIKSMRARALDKINGRKGPSSNMSTNYNSSNTSINNNSSNNIGASSTRRALSTTSASQGLSSSPSRVSAGQSERFAPRELPPISNSNSNTAVKVKRRSFGQSGTDRSSVPKISTRASQPERNHTTAASQPTNIRKRNSGSFKSQQIPLTSEDEQDAASRKDRAQCATEDGGVLVSELKALKARVQELEMERIDRSLSGLHVQDPQAPTQRHLGKTVLQDQSSSSQSDKLKQITQKQRGSGISSDTSSNLLRSPMVSSSSISRKQTRNLLSATPSNGNGRLESSTKVDSPTRTAQQPTTQHVALLQEAFKTFEKAMSSTRSTHANQAAQAMGKVVANAVSMNQTIRTWIKADVSPVESSSMTSLQRACDEQIRSLTESLLAMASMQSEADRSLTLSDNTAGGMAMDRPYSPRLSTGLQVFGHGQRMSLGMVGTELGAHGGFDQNAPYPTRPLSAVVLHNYDSAGSITPNAMSSSGYWTRNSSISSSIPTEARMRASLSQGYSSDFSQDQRSSYNAVGPSKYPHQGGISSRESSPPQENTQGVGQRRQVYAPALQDTQLTVESPRALHAAPYQLIQSPGPEYSTTDASAQLMRRQASVRNIMARYSQMSPRSPTFGQANLELETNMGQSPFENGMELQSQYEDQSQGLGYSVRQHQFLDRQYQSIQDAQDDVMSASVEFSSAGHPRAVHGSRRPLSQQEQHSFSGLRIPSSPLRQGGIIQRSGRYVHDKVFSEDESIGGWGSASLDQLPQRTRNGTYAVRLQQLRGRQDQLQPLHQQLEQFSQGGQQEQYLDHIQQQHQQQQRHGEYSDGTESEAFSESQIPLFAQRRPQFGAQRQQQQSMYQEHHGHAKHGQRQSAQHHQDMMMTTPVIPSPNSSPSSSSRVDGQSLASSNSHHGGLSNAESRYHLSPRGPADASTFPRQQSISSISGLSDDHYQSTLQQQQKRAMSLASQRSALLHQQQSSQMDGMSPQAQARLQKIMSDS